METWVWVQKIIKVFFEVIMKREILKEAIKAVLLEREFK